MDNAIVIGKTIKHGKDVWRVMSDGSFQFYSFGSHLHIHSGHPERPPCFAWVIYPKEQVPEAVRRLA